MVLKRWLAVAIVAATPAVFADVLLIDGVEMARQSADARPSRGMTMQRVEASFGTPQNRTAAIGDPPITRWDYADFVVYFEYDHVIHAVARR